MLSAIIRAIIPAMILVALATALGAPPVALTLGWKIALTIAVVALCDLHALIWRVSR
ncbi:hypothetical protein C8J25_103355 [Sphingomonas faeni]|uniref:Uncharacterized protein n=1 Tax=Sphingomonas faeni TaxID=185950 RepID=A0A2T5U829_9SPHN|nr:hypothetical protein C8J25_103355 [Sphingomonas faeni]